MQVRDPRKKTPVTKLALGIGLALQACAFASLAQDAAAPAEQAEQESLDTITVTGYRASVEKALDIKRAEKGVVDAVVAEDIGKFPDTNLAESLQRIPGVVITRDGGEGRNISVRGLGPQFTRVRLNGLETLSTVGSTDGQGGTNRGRDFDFNVFAADLFSQLIVRKTPSADVDEGSLGATVDLRTARPFDYAGFTAAGTVQAVYNDASEATTPRFAGLIGNTFADGKFGALLSVAYSERETRDEGSGTVRWAGGNTNGGFNPASPFSEALAADVYAPRFPRYTLMEHDQKRVGVTGALQFKPGDNTLFTLEGLYSKIDAVRDEKYIEANSLSKTGNNTVPGRKADIIVRDGVIENGALVYAQLDNVGIRAENRHDEWTTEFKQISLDGEHRFTDSFKLSGKLGTSTSQHDNPVQATIMMDRYNVNGYSYDYRGNMNEPVFNYGVDPTDPNGWVLSTIRMRANQVENTFDTGQLDFEWTVDEYLTVKGGVQVKEYGFESHEQRRRGTETFVPSFGGGSIAMPADMTELASLNGISGAPGAWVVPNFDALADLFDIFGGGDFAGINAGHTARPAVSGSFAMDPYAPSERSVAEKNRSAYLMGEFGFDLGTVPVSGNFGIRHVKTSQRSSGIATINGVLVPVTVERDYTDTLPAMNLVAEIAPDVLLRLGAAKVMTRPGLGSLTPGVTVNVSGSARTIAAGNPFLDPTRADTVDFGAEWYFSEGAMLSAGLFWKDLKSFIQNSRENVVYSETGLPASLLAGTTASTSDTFVLSAPLNTPGGTVKGVELNYVQPFTFLPGFWSNFGTQLNYTYVESEIQYLLSNGTPAQKEDFTGLSRNSWNATLYYEGERFSGRVSATNRDDYLIQVPGTEAGFNSEALGVHGQSGTTFVDASIRYKLNDHFELSLEGSNLTNEAQESWVANPDVQLPLEYSVTGRTFLLGMRYKF